MRFTVAAAAIGIWLAVASLTDALARELTPAQKRMQVCNSRAKKRACRAASVASS